VRDGQAIVAGLPDDGLVEQGRLVSTALDIRTPALQRERLGKVIPQVGLGEPVFLEEFIGQGQGLAQTDDRRVVLPGAVMKAGQEAQRGALAGGGP